MKNERKTVYSQSAEYYDRIYLQFKDYQLEAEQIDRLIKKFHPTAKTILDAACGTGSHAAALAQNYNYAVDGFDIEEKFVELAGKKHSLGNFCRADMSDFELGRRYDIITCLFSSIGYMKTTDRVMTALQRFKAHLNPGGIAIVESWFTPEKIKPIHFDMQTIDEEDLKLCRLSHTESDDKLTRIRFEYLLNDGSGIRHFSEIHEVGIFTAEEMKNCFAQSGFAVTYDPNGLTGRGIFIGKLNAKSI